MKLVMRTYIIIFNLNMIALTFHVCIHLAHSISISLGRRYHEEMQQGVKKEENAREWQTTKGKTGCIQWDNSNKRKTADNSKKQLTEETQTEWSKKETICKFWLENKCTRSQYCGYAHGRQEIGEKVEKNLTNKKTELCWYFKNGSGCWWGGECIFAHGEGELGTVEKPVAANQKGTGKGPGVKEAESHAVKEAGSPERSSCAAKSKSRERRHHGRSCRDSTKSSHERSCQPEVVSAEAGRAQKRRRRSRRGGSRRDSKSSRGGSRRDSPQVLPIIIQTDSLFPLHSNLSAK